MSFKNRLNGRFYENCKSIMKDTKNMNKKMRMTMFFVFIFTYVPSSNITPLIIIT